MASEHDKWFHGTVVTVTWKRTVGNENPVILPTIWTPSGLCSERWKLFPVSTFDVFQFTTDTRGQAWATGSKAQTFEFIAYSTGPSTTSASSTDRTELYDHLEGKCQPLTYGRYYSPGVCPESHTVAEMTAFPVKQNYSVETHYIASCCPSGMSFGPTARDYAQCISAISDPLRVLRPYTLTSDQFTKTFWDDETTHATLVNATTITQGLAVADPFTVAWQKHELYLFPTDYASSVAKQAGIQWEASSTPAPASTSTLPQETGQPPPEASRNLSTGGIVGIAVGVVGAILIGVAITWLYFRRKKQQTSEHATTTEGNPETPTAELEDQDQEHADRKWFLGGNWRTEVKTEDITRELDSRAVNVVPGPPVEMDATEKGLERNET